MPLAPPRASLLGRLSFGALTLLTAGGAGADLEPLGPVFLVNAQTAGGQSIPRLANLPGGKLIAVWKSSGQDRDGLGIVARFIEQRAGPSGPEIVVNSNASGDQDAPAVAAGIEGEFLVVWSSSGVDGSSSGVVARHFDSKGVAAGAEVLVNAHTSSFQISPWAAPRREGGFVVVWESNLQDGDGLGVFGRLLDEGGMPLGAEFRVNRDREGDQRQPRIAAAPDGGFVVTWWDEQTPIPWVVDGEARRLTSDGVPVGEDLRLNTSVRTQSQPSIAFGADGGFVALWSASTPESVERGVWARRFDALGDPLGPDFRIDSGIAAWHAHAELVSDGRGAFIATWEQTPGPGLEDWDVVGVRLGAAGVPEGPEVRLSDLTRLYTTYPTAIARPGGRILVAWTDDEDRDGDQSGVFARRVVVSPEIFADAFESGDTSAWDRSSP